MMENQTTKEMTGTEPDLKKKGMEIKNPKILRCINECHMPNVGDFKVGDTVDDQRKVAQINDNPNFEEIKGSMTQGEKS